MSFVCLFCQKDLKYKSQGEEGATGRSLGLDSEVPRREKNSQPRGFPVWKVPIESSEDVSDGNQGAAAVAAARRRPLADFQGQRDWARVGVVPLGLGNGVCLQQNKTRGEVSWRRTGIRTVKQLSSRRDQQKFAVEGRGREVEAARCCYSIQKKRGRGRRHRRGCGSGLGDAQVGVKRASKSSKWMLRGLVSVIEGG